MSGPWPRVRLGEVVTPIQRAEAVKADREYRLLGIRLDGQGPFLREVVAGAETSATTLYRVATGDFIYSRLFAWRGAFGVIGEKLERCYVSAEFPTFRVSPDRLDAEFLRLWFCSPNVLRRVERDCSGSTPLTRNRFKEQFFLALELPLPTLPEQRRLVRRVDTIAVELKARADATKQAEADLNALLRSLLANDSNLTPVPMRDLVKLRHLDVQVQPTETYQFAGVYSFGRGVFRSQRKLGAEFAYTRLTTLRAGDFTYPKLMAWEGAFGVVPPACEGCVVSPEFPVFEVNRHRVLPEVLDVHFRDPSVWPVLAGTSTGTNARRRRLNPEALLAYLFPLPSSRTQKKLGKISEEVAALRRVRAEADAEAAQLLPSLLAEAFSNSAALWAGHPSPVDAAANATSH